MIYAPHTFQDRGSIYCALCGYTKQHRIHQPGTALPSIKAYRYAVDYSILGRPRTVLYRADEKGSAEHDAWQYQGVLTDRKTGERFSVRREFIRTPIAEEASK